MANTNLRIKELCKMKGITQKELAAKLGYTGEYGHISFYQALGRNNFDMNRLSDIADALGCPVSYLFEDRETTVKCPVCGAELSIHAK